MSSHPNSNPDRLAELLADQALHGLAEAEALELDRLLLAHPELDADEFDRLAAALDAGLTGAAQESMPAGLVAKLEASADDWIASEQQSVSESPQVIARLNWAPWLVAAASLALAVFVWISNPGAPSAGTPTIAEAFSTFVDTPPADLIRVDWQPIAKEYSVPAETFSGEVVWSGSEQRGYMVFEGLPPNDPNVEQFQLWIIDSSRGDSPPVDGGVFDVDSTGRVIVPIRAALDIGAVAAFAVTVEQPGGVVVSTQDRIATLAPVG